MKRIDQSEYHLVKISENDFQLKRYGENNKKILVSLYKPLILHTGVSFGKPKLALYLYTKEEIYQLIVSDLRATMRSRNLKLLSIEPAMKRRNSHPDIMVTHCHLKEIN
jgi:hypothetical protein